MALGRVFLPKKHTPTLARNDSIVPHGYIITLSVFLQENKTHVFRESDANQIPAVWQHDEQQSISVRSSGGIDSPGQFHCCFFDFFSV